MPAIKKISKNDIIKTSIAIIRKEGLTGLNARKLAKELGCSTQPIFYVYSSMDEIKVDIMREISLIFDNAMLESNYNKPVYKDIGKNYIKFAKNEPMLFKILFNSNTNEQVQCFIDLTRSSKQIYETICNQTGLSGDDAKKFHLKMWLYVNGIANLVANNTCRFSDEEIDDLLGQQYISMLLFEIKKGTIKEDVLNNTMRYILKRKEDL